MTKLNGNSINLVEMITNDIIERVWSKARIENGYNPDLVRKDACGAWIMKNHYGNRNSDYGWEIDHVYPISMGGSDAEINLRAMQWENNLAKGDDYPIYLSKIQAGGNKNINKESQFTINQELREQLDSLYLK